MDCFSRSYVKEGESRKITLNDRLFLRSDRLNANEQQGTVSKCSIEKDGFFNQNTIAETLLEIANKPLIVLGMGYFAKLSM